MPPDTVRGAAPLIAVATAAMALPMIVVSLVGALGPMIVDDIGVSRSALGFLTATTMGLAAVFSLWAGQVVDRIGPHAALGWLFGLVALSFALMSISSGFVLLLLAVAIASPAQALANPATNKLIAMELASVRAVAIGVKQSGVQVAALLAGAGLAPAAVALGWQGAVALLVPLAAVVFALVRWLVPRRPRPPAGVRLALPAVPVASMRWLMLAQLCLGFALATVTTFLPLYAAADLGVPAAVAGLMLAVFAVAGVVSRIVWNRLADRSGHIADILVLVCALSIVGPLLLVAGAVLSPAAAWLGAVWIGATATAANAVSMLLVISNPRLGPVGSASALASLGFFGGFAIGPPLTGAIADSALGFPAAWVACSIALAAGAVAAHIARGSLRRSRGTIEPATTASPT